MPAVQPVFMLALLLCCLLAQNPPPQRSLEVPPISDPSRTAVLTGFVPSRPPGEEGRPVSSALRTVVWVLRPPSLRTQPLGDQVIVLGPDDFAPATLAVTPGTRIDFRSTERGVRVIRGSGLLRFERRLTRDTRAIPVIPPNMGAIQLSVRDLPGAAGAIVAVDSPFLSVAASDGAFRIVGLPPGRRDVRIRLPDGRVLERRVDLRAGEETMVDWREKDTTAGSAAP